MNQFSCQELLDQTKLLYIADQFASADFIRIIPLTVSGNDEIRAICPCCVLDKRSDIPELEHLRRDDPWVMFFRRIKAKEHSISIHETDTVFAPGFALRSITEQNRRARYANVDSPLSKNLGFKGHKFDKNFFLPLAIHRAETAIRIGIVNPSLLIEYPLLARASASWLFRSISVLPHPVPDLFPIASIGTTKIAEESTETINDNKPVVIGDFFSALTIRSNKRRFRESLKRQKSALLKDTLPSPIRLPWESELSHPIEPSQSLGSTEEIGQ